MPSPVIIVAYDPRWPLLYEEEKRRIVGVIGPKIVAIEHVGSTSVVGLGAKPIIDISVGIRQLDDAKECIEPLKSIGYTYFPELEADIPDRRYFDRQSEEGQVYHLHMSEFGGSFWESHILFRDYLRTHPEGARQYYLLKKELAAKHGTDREGYTNAKTPFIESALDKARRSKATKTEDK